MVIQPKASKAVSDGGIIIPDSGREKPREAEVLAVGPGAVCEHCGERMAPQVKPGDVVLFNRYHKGQAVDATHVVDYRNKDGDGPLLMPADDVLGVLEP